MIDIAVPIDSNIRKMEHKKHERAERRARKDKEGESNSGPCGNQNARSCDPPEPLSLSLEECSPKVLCKTLELTYNKMAEIRQNSGVEIDRHPAENMMVFVCHL